MVKLERDGMDVTLALATLKDSKPTRRGVLIVYRWHKRNGLENVGIVNRTQIL